MSYRLILGADYIVEGVVFFFHLVSKLKRLTFLRYTEKDIPRTKMWLTLPVKSTLVGCSVLFSGGMMGFCTL